MRKKKKNTIDLRLSTVFKRDARSDWTGLEKFTRLPVPPIPESWVQPFAKACLRITKSAEKKISMNRVGKLIVTIPIYPMR